MAERIRIKKLTWLVQCTCVLNAELKAADGHAKLYTCRYRKREENGDQINGGLKILRKGQNPDKINIAEAERQAKEMKDGKHTLFSYCCEQLAENRNYDFC